jgi:hypothetical protein
LDLNNGLGEIQPTLYGVWADISRRLDLVRRRPAICFALLGFLASAAPGHAQVKESLCEAAKVESLKSAKGIEERLQRYAECVRMSDGAEDCRSEFGHLRTAQAGFERIARQHRTYCRD